MAASESESRFEGAGQEFHAKYMGSVDVAKSKGQEVCQEAMQKLLVALKGRKDPKPRLIINLSYEGTRLKEMPPGFNLLDLMFKHSQVSYVWKDPRDQRSLGIVRSEPDPEDASKTVHKFHGIRTVKPAMPFLQMQELFRIVKERSAQQKERSASVASTAAAATTEKPAEEPQHQQEQEQQQIPASGSSNDRDRALSNLLGGDLPPGESGMPKNESVASLDDLGDIFSSSATVSQPPPTSQPMRGGGGSGNPFGQQPMGGGGGNPFGGGSGQAQPMGGGGGSGMGGNPFGQQPMVGGGGNPFGGGVSQAQPMAGFGNPFGQQQPQQRPPGQVGMMAAPGFGPSAGFGGGMQQPPYQQQQYPQRQYQQQYSQPYYQQQQHQQPGMANTNPFAFGGGGGNSSLFDRQNSAPSGGAGADLLTPMSMNAPADSGAASKQAAAKPDAFGDLVIGLKSDPQRQQLSSKELFKPTDKPKTTLRDLANQSPRP